MKTNEGKLDRKLREVSGVFLIGLAATDTIGVWGYVGAVPLLTGTVGLCPLHLLLGINTCPVSTRLISAGFGDVLYTVNIFTEGSA